MQINRFLVGPGRPAPDHHAVFHAFAETLARVIRPARPAARVRAVRG